VEWRAGRRRNATGPGAGEKCSPLPILPYHDSLRGIFLEAKGNPQRFVHYTLCYYRTHRAELAENNPKIECRILGILFFSKRKFKIVEKEYQGIFQK
jgi:hypothetical protein